MAKARFFRFRREGTPVIECCAQLHLTTQDGVGHLRAGRHHHGFLRREAAHEIGAEPVFEQIGPVELGAGGRILNGELVAGEARRQQVAPGFRRLRRRQDMRVIDRHDADRLRRRPVAVHLGTGWERGVFRRIVAEQLVLPSHLDESGSVRRKHRIKTAAPGGNFRIHARQHTSRRRRVEPARDIQERIFRAERGHEPLEVLARRGIGDSERAFPTCRRHHGGIGRARHRRRGDRQGDQTGEQ
jgi:hypothetical protein